MSRIWQVVARAYDRALINSHDLPHVIPYDVTFSLPAGTHAMGIYAPPQPSKNMTGPTFGRFNFPAAKVVKWNCVFRLTDPAGLKPADYSFRMFVVVGVLQTVQDSMRSLVREFARQP